LNQVIQQNAGAAEEMSSTAEELSSQAEQLQSTISFFRVAESEGSYERRAAAGRRAEPAHKPRVAQLAQKPKTANPAVSTAVKQGGVALDMRHEAWKGNGDSQDAEFEKF
jgi:methyl-accepting chemotaxis protein